MQPLEFNIDEFSKNFEWRGRTIESVENEPIREEKSMQTASVRVCSKNDFERVNAGHIWDSTDKKYLQISKG